MKREHLARITGLTHQERNDVLIWFSKQAEDNRVEIMMGRFHKFHKIKKTYGLEAPVLDYCALLLACKDYGWTADKKYRSSASLLSTDITKMSQRRIARAKEYTRSTSTNERLAVHWGKVVELRGIGFGFRKIARSLSTELRINVSHTTIWKLWGKWENDG